jgi:hypothetical protein
MTERQRVECFRAPHIRLLSQGKPRLNPGLSFPGPLGQGYDSTLIQAFGKCPKLRSKAGRLTHNACERRICTALFPTKWKERITSWLNSAYCSYSSRFLPVEKIGWDPRLLRSLSELPRLGTA